MDNNEPVFEGHGGGRVGDDFRPEQASAELTISDLRKLKIVSLEQVEHLVGLYAQLNVPKPHPLLFLEQMTAKKDSWFVEAGDLGLIFLTDIVPERNANLHVFFWDLKFDKSRRELVLAALATAFNLFNFLRVTVIVPDTAGPLKERYLRMGFTLEGTIRKSGPGGIDEHILGLLREELPCHVTPVPTSFLA